MRLCLASVGLVLVSGIALAGDAAWRVYANPRFGVAVDYPSTFTVRDPPPGNGDGQGFRTARGDATLRVFGSYNIDDASADRLMQTYRDSGTDYSYSKATRSWFVLSGTKDGKISYLRCNLGPSDIVGCAELDYPAKDAGQWSSAIERIGRSLRILPVHRS